MRDQDRKWGDFVTGLHGGNRIMKAISYLTDRKGKRTAVVIPLHGNEGAVEEFLEDLYGHRKIQERSKESTITAETLVKGLKNDGLL